MKRALRINVFNVALKETSVVQLLHSGYKMHYLSIICRFLSPLSQKVCKSITDTLASLACMSIRKCHTRLTNKWLSSYFKL